MFACAVRIEFSQGKVMRKEEKQGKGLNIKRKENRNLKPLKILLDARQLAFNVDQTLVILVVCVRIVVHDRREERM